MSQPRKPDLFEDEEERTEHSKPGDLPFTPAPDGVPLFSDEEDATELARPSDLPFGLNDEDDEPTRLEPPPRR